MKYAALILITAAIACSCTKDGRPRDAIETELSTTTVLGDFDVEYGQIGYTTVFVNLDGRPYQLAAEPDAVFRGFEGLSRMELNGRRALVAGDVVDGVYWATYAELVPVVQPKVDPAIQEMVARRKILETELFELHREHSRLMLEGIQIRLNESKSESSIDENEAALISIEAQIDAVEAQFDLVDHQISDAEQGL